MKYIGKKMGVKKCVCTVCVYTVLCLYGVYNLYYYIVYSLCTVCVWPGCTVCTV